MTFDTLIRVKVFLLMYVHVFQRFDTLMCVSVSTRLI